MGSILLSGRFMGFCFIAFAFSMGIGTFIENDFDTATARDLIYEAWWFELLMFLLALIFLTNIKRYKLWRREKWSVLLFHLGLVVTMLGGAVTRYVGYEGVMHIRQGETVDYIISEKTYLKVRIDNNEVQREYVLPIHLSQIGDPDFKTELSFLEHRVSLSVQNFIPNAIEKIEKNTGSETDIIHIVISKNGQRENFYLKESDTQKIDQFIFSSDQKSFSPDFINIRKNENQTSWEIRFPQETRFIKMATQEQGQLPKNVWTTLIKKSLYSIGSTNFVIKDIYPNASITFIPSPSPKSLQEDMITLGVGVHHTDQSPPETYTSVTTGGKGILNAPKELKTKHLNLYFSYGSVKIPVPFAIKLDRFELLRYPGSNSPSSFKSDLTLITDKPRKVSISMNNVLDYEGFRLFQSSYDQDELGTILSVNHDVWGKNITYTGYFALFIGMFFTLFSKKSRFRTLNQKLSKLNHTSLFGFFMVVIFSMVPEISQAQHIPDHHRFQNTDSLMLLVRVPEKQAEKFSELLVQDPGGRIKPLHTLASEILRKVHHRNDFKGMTPEQVLLSALLYPIEWQFIPILYIKDKGVRALFHNRKYVKFFDFFDSQGTYLISEKVRQAHQKKPSKRNNLDKEMIALDERLNIWFNTLNMSFLKLFPLPQSEKNIWASPTEDFSGISPEDSTFITKIIPWYQKSLREGLHSKNWKKAEEKLAYIREYQSHYGANISPSASQQKLEIFYNKSSLFKRLSNYYLLLGILMLIVNFWQIFSFSNIPKKIYRLLSVLALALFLAHTTGLGLRWYISGHAPWSNGYESMIYVGWATVLSGIIFSKKAPMTLSATVFLTGITLWVAGLNWLDPEITNLVPVLKSYWLMIHVAIIVASYGFFGLGALLGFINLCLMAFGRIRQGDASYLSIKKMTYIVEMTLTIGLFMLSIGTFLGGIWANESWGRYWSWDPKETWALTSVMVYAFILHMRFIPRMGSMLTFNTAAIVGFGSILMTYFGVNYYLGGLHSYAKGDPIPVPEFLYYLCATILLVYLLARYRQKSFSLKGKIQKSETNQNIKVEQ